MLWSTGGLFIKWTSLSGLELSFGRSLLAAITVAIFTRREGFGLNKVTALASVLYAALLLLFVLATKQTTAANAIFLQYTAPVYLLIFEPLFYKEKFRSTDLIVVVACVLGMSLFFVGKLRHRARPHRAVQAAELALGRLRPKVGALEQEGDRLCGQSRFLGNLRQPAGCTARRARRFKSNSANDIARCSECDLSRRGADWPGVYALHRRDGAWGALP